MQNATSPVAPLEEFGPHELESDARILSAKVPIEQVPSVLAELPAAVAAYAPGITCTAGDSSATAVTAATAANAATIIVLMIISVLVSNAFSIVTVLEKLQK
jgi:hypothetical protein